MSLSSFGPALFAAGLGALAGLLFLLQRLRVRHREVRVPTTLFWHEAVEESRARVFVRRFRHPWAYLLVLAIASLLWLAAAMPRSGGGGDVEHLLLLDGSAAMRRGERFAEAADAVRARAAALPRAATRVVFAGSRPLTVLAPGEDLALLGRRLRGLQPEACPSTLVDAVRAVAAVTAPGRRLLVEIHGDGALDPAWAAVLRDAVAIHRVSDAPDPAPSEAGVVAFGVSEAASGRWDAVDLYARVAGADAGRALAMRDEDGGAAPETERGESAGEFLLRDAPARGGRWTAQLGADSFAADDRADRVLPERAPLRVALSPRVPASARAALAADSGVQLVDEDPEVVLRAAGEDFGAGAPALELADEDSGAAAFVVRGPVTTDAERELGRTFERLGLREVDAVALAEASGRAIELQFAEDPERRSIAVWSSLFGDAFDFVQSRAFPLFLAASVRWLAGVPDLQPDLAAGAWFPAEAAPLRGPEGAPLDGAGAPFRLPRAGDWTGAGGEPVAVALLDPALHDARAHASFHDAVPAGGAAARHWLPWIAALALALLAAEWVLVRRERMP